mmetsp:Transcript_32555/g.71865  ORF Transcript_32555/g.71865 Transcript_32555/m.71865 type:complete len:359 (+) Transcript_32555:60-1136(+)
MQASAPAKAAIESALWTTNKFGSLKHDPLLALADPANLARALKDQSIGFSFSGGGFLLPYYVGTLSALKQLGLLQPGKTHVAGSSAGSLAAVIAACNLSMEEIFATFKAVSDDCAKNGVFRRLSASVKQQLQSILPESAHLMCNDVVHIGITKVKPYGALHSKTVSRFSSRDDLISALLASCHIPVLSTGSFTTRFRGRRVLDGGVTDMMPLPSVGLAHVVKVSCMPQEALSSIPIMNKARALHHISISPCKFNDFPYTPKQTLKWALEPGPPEFSVFLSEQGYRDVLSWAQAGGLATSHVPPALRLSGPDEGQQLAAAAAAAHAVKSSETGHVQVKGQALDGKVVVAQTVAVGAAAK